MSALLIVSAGKSDLQVAAHVKGSDVRLRLSEQTLRAAHEALLAQPNRYFVDENAAGHEESKELWVRCNGDSFELSPDGASAPTPLPYPVSLAPAKLSGIGKVIPDKPEAIIVFNTRRDRDTREPVAAGPILSQWLAVVFGLEWAAKPGILGLGKSGWVDFLTGKMRAEGHGGEDVDRQAVGIIDATLKSTGRFECVYFALGGGMPDFREQIRAAARFRFPDAQFSEIRLPEGGKPKLVEANAPLILPSDSFRARQQARVLVRNGDFMGAWVIGRPYTVESWVLPLKWAAQYFDGRQDSEGEYDDYLQVLTGRGIPHCLLPAMRAEAALRNGRLRDAIIDTASFKDAAMVDYISRLAFVESVDEFGQTIKIKPGEKVPPNLLRRTRDIAPCLEQPMKWGGDVRAKNRNNKPVFRYRTGVSFDDRWLATINPSGRCLVAFLKKFNERLRDDLPSTRVIRNVIAHHALPGETMRRIRTALESKGIWSTATAAGYFLGQSEVAASLRELGYSNPIKLYDGVVEGVLQAMVDYRIA